MTLEERVKALELADAEALKVMDMVIQTLDTYGRALMIARAEIAKLKSANALLAPPKGETV